MNALTARIRPAFNRHSSLLAILLVVIAGLAVYGAGSGQSAWEVEFMRGVQAASPPPLRWVAHAMTAIGNWPIYPLMTASAVGVLFWARHRSLAVLVAAAALLRMISPLLKDIVDRERPSAALVDVSSQLSTPAFPSGHVLSATLFFGVLVYVVEVAVPHPTLKRWLQGGLISLIVLMGYARVELGEHWPTDVMGGWAVGALMLIFLCRAHRAFAPAAAATSED